MIAQPARRRQAALLVAALGRNCRTTIGIEW